MVKSTLYWRVVFMSVALVVLCLSGVAFLLRVLFALVGEMRNTPYRATFHLTRFDPSSERTRIVATRRAADLPPASRVFRYSNGALNLRRL